MNKIKFLREVFDLFTPYEKSMLQIKRHTCEQQKGLRFVSLFAYVNYLYNEIPDKPAELEDLSKVI